VAVSNVAICNSALVKIGAKRITALTDNTPEARLCSEQYAKVRDDLLRSHPWNFAIKRVQLATATTPAFYYTHAFTIPADCLRVLSIIELDDTTEWRKEGNKILCFEPTLSLTYIAKITDTTIYDSVFDEVLALKLAHDICYALTQSTTLKQLLAEEYKNALKDARTFDAQESSVQTVWSRDFFNSRF
jgi:hypothetical protein